MIIKLTTMTKIETIRMIYNNDDDDKSTNHKTENDDEDSDNKDDKDNDDEKEMIMKLSMMTKIGTIWIITITMTRTK